jgi:plastocyanin
MVYEAATGPDVIQQVLRPRSRGMQHRSLDLRRPKLAPLVALPVVVVGLIGIVAGTDGGDRTPVGRSTEGDRISIAGFAFAPDTVEVEAGTTVVWTNQDGAAHSVADARGLFEESDDLQAGDEFRFTYDEPGRYPYFCGIHQSMRGEVNVRA